MRYHVLILLFLAIPAYAQDAPLCVGKGCPTILADLPNNDPLNEALHICNSHALPGVYVWEESFYGQCQKVVTKWMSIRRQQATDIQATTAAERARIDELLK